MRPSSALAPPVTSVALSAVVDAGAAATTCCCRCCVLCRARLLSFGRPLGTPSDQALAAEMRRRSFIMLALVLTVAEGGRLYVEALAWCNTGCCGANGQRQKARGPDASV